MKSYHRQVHWTFRELVILTRRRQQYSFSMKKLHDFVQAALSGSWFARSRVALAPLLQFQRCSLLPVLPPLAFFLVLDCQHSSPWLSSSLSFNCHPSSPWLPLHRGARVVDSAAYGFSGRWQIGSLSPALIVNVPFLYCHFSADGFFGTGWSGRRAAWVLPDCKACEIIRVPRLHHIGFPMHLVNHSFWWQF